jgi:uncharacterized protein YceH (UPF0502 family)
VPYLDAEELRVLGCLVEKEATVPDSYPMTLNGLRTACNQQTSREPVVRYDDSTVLRALESLKDRGLVRFVHASHGARTTKYRHVVDEALDLDRPALAVLSLLWLRGPQTANELRTRAERQHGFDSSAEVEMVLAELARGDEPRVVRVGRLPGQRDDRWAHLMAGEPVPAAPEPAPQPDATEEPGLAERIAALEAKVAELERLILDR